MKLRLLLSSLLFTALSACSMPAITDTGNAVASVGSSDLMVLDHHVIPPDKVNDLKITELSGLAWDEDEQLLYAISDKGRVYHFQLTIDKNDLIQSVKPVFAAKLRNVKGKKLKKYRRDAEGLMVWNANNGKKGDTQLIISLEGEPRIVRFTPQGRAIVNIKVPDPLRDQHNFRHPNSGLESITYHPRYGFITAPEESIKGQPKNLHTVYATKKQWSFMAYPVKNSSITALEVIPGSNQMLVMERAWSGFPNPLTISLRRIDLDKCSDKGACAAEDLKVFSSSLSIDNFEGMTHIGNKRYLIVSDDGKSDLLRTLLTLFKVE